MMMKIFIISGLSGSGKSIALQALEDLGYYCIDNLPAVLLAQLVTELLRDESNAPRIDRIAVSIDSRNRRFLASLQSNLNALQQRGLAYRLIFLEADDPVLIKRFSETRRRHPLTDEGTPLIDGIRRERALLAPLSNNATRHINTSQTTPHELRRLMRDIAGGEDWAGLILLFESFGYKHGAPLDADFVFDVRCLPNPHWQPELRLLTGLDGPVAGFLDKHETVLEMIKQIRSFIETWLPSFEAEQRSYITVAIGCTGGRHRSVYIAQQLGDYFATRRINVQTRHRELLAGDSDPPPVHQRDVA
jgi:UPF0042 nucleotide-binding protein